MSAIKNIIKRTPIKRRLSDEDYNDIQNIKRNKETIWNKLNKYISAKCENNKINDNIDWVSATKIKNYLIKDPILDWLDYTKKRTSFITNNLNNTNILFEKGLNFENKIMDYLKETYPNDFIQVSQNVSDINQIKGIETENLIKSGKPIIAQAVLFNNNNKTFGCADILIRSDWINKLFEKKPLTIEEETIKASKLNDNYHYRVIDIKWTTLKLCADGIHLRNIDLMPAYKGQLAIYNCALGNIQGYFPDKTYIMGKSWKYIHKNQDYEGINCFDLLGQIEYDNYKCDDGYIDLTCKAIEWIRRMRRNAYNWTVYPKPSVSELYPNMSNTKDEPYYNRKKKIAEKINELTLLWNVGYENRQIAHKNNIYSWKDAHCNSENLGFNNGKIYDTLNKIIKINQSSTDIIKPEKISNNYNNWQKESVLDFYVDFETINLTLNNEIDIFNSNSQHDTSSFIFMIGIGYIENNEWKFKNIYAPNNTYNYEFNIINQMKEFIEEKQKEYPKLPIRIFHWSHAEKTFITSADDRHRHKWTEWLSKIEWIDLCQILKSEPIVIKDAFDFSIKSIGTALFKHNKINTHWDTNITNGLNAMMDAIKYYKTKDESIIRDIEKYNEIDCKIMWEITNYLRKNHV
jgi:hypothetical protein